MPEADPIGDAVARGVARAPPRAPGARCRWPTIVAAGRSCAIATATQPQPVQTSAIVQRRLRDPETARESPRRSARSPGRRNQHVGRHLELEPPELAVADDVGERFAGDAAGDQRVVARVRSRRAPALLASVRNRSVVQPSTCCASSRASRSDSVGVDAGVAQPLPRRGDLRMDASRDRRRVLELLGLVVRRNTPGRLFRQARRPARWSPRFFQARPLRSHAEEYRRPPAKTPGPLR